MRNKPVATCLLVLSCVLPVWGQVQADDQQERILAVFHPYGQGVPQVEGIRPGMTIDKTNYQVASAVLPPEILKYVQAGDFTITVRETTDMPLRQDYIQATLAHSPHVELGEGELRNYVAGLPFPLLDPEDLRAGEKAAWNHRYRDRGENVQYWPTNELRNSSGAVERADRFYTASIYGMHRPQTTWNVPQWEEGGIYSKQYLRTLAPSDTEGNQTLSYSHDKDTSSDDLWVYDVKTRRARKVVDNPYQAGGGGELLMEDRSGFAGYIHAYEWKYLGEQVLLVPGPIQAAESTWGGRGNWYPMDPWELRRMVVVEARPKGEHPVYSRRVLYIDSQTWVTSYALTYDPAGNHKRTFFMVYLHPQFNPWKQEVWIPQIATQASIDYQRERASIFQTHKVIYDQPLNPHRFTLAGLMLQGK